MIKLYVSLHTSDCRNSHLEMVTLVGDSLDSTVTDCGATKTVCGIIWYNCCVNTLSEMQKKNIQTQESNTYFKFGDDPTDETIKKAKFSPL